MLLRKVLLITLGILILGECIYLAYLVKKLRQLQQITTIQTIQKK